MALCEQPEDSQGERRPLQHRSQATQNAILAAASRLLRATGPAGVTFAGIARAAGVSVGAIQFHFPGKDALVQATIARELDQVIAAERTMLQTLIAAEPDLDTFLARYIEALGGILAAFHPMIARTMKIITADPVLGPKGRAAGDASYHLFCQALDTVGRRNDMEITGDSSDAVYHVIFSYTVREINFPSAPASSKDHLRRRRALAAMCSAHLRTGSTTGSTRADPPIINHPDEIE